MISFLQPIALLGLILALTPILIHLLNLMRHRTQPWAAMRFIRQAKKFSSRFSKIRRWLTLLARVLAIASLVFLLARPIASPDHSLFSFSPNEPELTLLVLDRSASMERTCQGSNLSLREKALREFGTISKAWPNSRLFCIETVFAEPILIDEPETLGKTEMTDFFGPTDSDANLPRTINQALEWLQETEVKSAEIIVASDFQSSSWQISENIKVLRKISEAVAKRNGMWKIRFLKLEPDRSLNRSMRAQTVRETDQSILPTLLIRSNQNSNESMVVEVRVDGTLSMIDFNFTAPQSVWTPKLSRPAQSPSGWVTLSLPADASASDNSHYLTYGKTDREKISLLASNSEVRRVLEAAASLQGDEVSSLSVSEATYETDLGAGKLILFQGNFEEPLSKKFIAMVEDGATVVLFPPELKESFRSEAQNWALLESIDENNPFSVSQWNPDSGILADTSSGQNLPLPQLEIFKRKIPMLGQALAYYSDGKPFLTRRVLGKGIIYSFSTLPIASWSSLAEGYVLVPSILRIIEEGRSSYAMYGFDCGGPESRELTNAKPVTGNPSDQPSVRAGIYQANGRLFAFNRPTQETNPESIVPAELNEITGNPHLSWMGADESETVFKQSELWRFFLILMIILLLAESFLGLPTAKAQRAKNHAP